MQSVGVVGNVATFEGSRSRKWRNGSEWVGQNEFKLFGCH